MAGVWGGGWAVGLCVLYALAHLPVGNCSAADVARAGRKHHPPRLTAGMSVALTVGQDAVFSEFMGWQDSRKRVKITNDSVYLMASVTKTVTAFALLQTFEKVFQPLGLTLDDRYLEFLPFNDSIPENFRNFTLRQLLHHTSGLRDNWDVLNRTVVVGRPIGMKDFLMGYLANSGPYAAQLYDPIRNFGEVDKFSYSNVGFTLLGYLIGANSGMSFEEFTQKHIFEPLGLNTHPSNLAKWHLSEVPMWQMTLPGGVGEPYSFPGYPNGGLRATLSAIAAILQLFIAKGVAKSGQRLLSESLVNQWVSFSPLTIETAYSMGLEVKAEGAYGDRILFGHDGGDLGVSTVLFWQPTSCPIGVTVLSNQGWMPAPLPGLPTRVARLLLDAFTPSERVKQTGCRLKHSLSPSMQKKILHLAVAEAMMDARNPWKYCHSAPHKFEARGEEEEGEEWQQLGAYDPAEWPRMAASIRSLMGEKPSA